MKGSDPTPADPGDELLLDELLLDWALGLLPAAEAEALEARLAADPALAARADALRAEQAVLGEALGAGEADPALEARLVAGLRAAPPLPVERAFRWRRWVAAAAGVLIAALAGARMLDRREPPRQQLIGHLRLSELKAMSDDEETP
ncbi:MAG: hypothetical protein AB7N76_04710 [Planctomycetota bacterium]